MYFDQPEVSPVPHQKQYILLNDYTIKWGKEKIIVPEYFLFDGASIPSIGWKIFFTPFNYYVLMPALAHDWVYVSHQLSRKDADIMFRDLLIRNGVITAKANSMKKILQLFGGKAWEWQKEDIKKMHLLYSLIKTSPRFEDYKFPMEILNL